MRATPARLLALLAFLGLSLPAHAEVHPNTAPGFPADQSFHVGDIDNINLFNGALTLTIPLGGSYPVNGGFSYGLKLIYNANPWEFITTTIILPDGTEVTQRFAFPNGCSNAGFGFRVSLGRLDPPCHGEEMHEALYQDENGTDHIFYPTLHDGDPEDAPVSGVTKVVYTRDGTYLRLKVYTSGVRELEFPDGSLRRFNGSGLPELIRDPFGNSLTISYATPNQWVLSDSQGRTHRIVFRTDLPDWPAETVDRIELAAFGGTTAVYQFGYNMQAVGRACPNSDTSLGNTVTVPLLTLLTLPDGSSYHNTVNDYVIAPPSNSLCTEHSGNLLGLNLPTEGRLEWSWQTYRFNQSSTSKPYLQRSSGVATRTMRDNNGVVLGTWSYATAITPNLSNQEQTTTVTDPLGHRTVNFFSTSMAGSFTGWSKFDYSLPFTRAQTLNVAPGVDLNLSRQIFNSAGTLLRSEYVLYERDPNPITAAPPDADNTNRRVMRSRTVFHDDGVNFAGVVNSNFDGLGHYRQQQAEESLPGSNVRTHFGNYNPARGTYVVNQAANTGAGFNVFPPGTPWVTETMTLTSDSEAGATAQTELCYAPNSTAVVRQRVHRLDGAAQGAADLVTVHDLDAAGNVVSEKSYGGDSQAVLPTGGIDLCTMALPASPKYQVDHTYAFGSRATSRYSGTSHFILNQGIDFNTGLVSASTDSADLTTSYEYDRLGRMTWSKPQLGHGGWMEAVYSPAVGTQRATVTLRHRDNGSKSAPVLQTEFLLFDGFGRIFQEQRQLPSGQVNRHETLYDSAGNKASVSELATGTPSNRTQFLNYDPFGRPGIIRPPDGAGHDVTMTYQGVRQVDRTVKVATSSSAETAVTTTEIYDHHGRLLSVTEPSGSGGTNVTTTYGYDVGNRLSSVSTTAGSTTQNRAFNYDRAGLLISETHPEKGTFGNDSVSYPQYDARGHLLRKIDGPNDLTFVYDTAERVTLVRETGGAQRTLKSFAYSSSNGTFNDPILGPCTDYRQSKLTQQSRFNYVVVGSTPFTVELREGMTYCGRDGRQSRRTLENWVNGVLNESFVLPNITYGALGNVTALAYPQCTHAACAAPAPRTITNTYTAGLLSAVGVPGNASAYASAITYHPNLMVNQVVHANGLTDTYALDPNSMRRPAAITVTNAAGAVRWTTGTYSFDGAGNVKAIGTHSFVYDPVSRLTAANLFLEPTSSVTPRSQTYTFDAFGNLQAIGGNSGRNTPTSSATNRLTTGTYDAAGNLTSWNGNLYAYDPFNLMWDYRTPSDEWIYLYTADDERAWVYKTDNTSLWTLRSPDAKVLREYTNNGTWRVASDYVYRDSSLLAAETPQGTRHFSLDHLDTPRLITAAGSGGDFFTLTPCRVLDTRAQSAPLAAGETRVVPMTGSCGIPSSATAVSVNITVVDPTAQGELTAFPANELRPTASAISYPAGLVRANNAILKLSTGALAFFANQPAGTVHLLIDVNGYFQEGPDTVVAYHVYYPFGEEATTFNQDTIREKFTGHERDLGNPGGPGDDLDYMHARHCSPITGRFLGVDPALESAEPNMPQTWNRYNYVAGNPLKFVDPSGEILIFYGLASQRRRLEQIANQTLYGLDLVIDRRGRASLARNTESGPPTPEQQAFADTLSIAIARAQDIRLNLVSGDSEVLVGDYLHSRIDIQDLVAAGSEEPAGSGSLLAHEIAEQTAKQGVGLKDNMADYSSAHLIGTLAQTAVAGYAPGDRLKLMAFGNGVVIAPHTRGNQVTIVTLVWANGNLVKVIRR